MPSPIKENNVGVGDLAILLHAKYPENNGRICTIIKQVPPPPGGADGVWWWCEYQTLIMTDAFKEYGLIPYSVSEDWRLRKITDSTTNFDAVEELINNTLILC